MDFNYTPEEEKFRDQFKQWLAINMKELPEWCMNKNVLGPEVDSEEYHEFALSWHKKLYDAGYVGITWPKKYGGQGGTPMEEAIFYEEIAKHRCPGITNHHGVGWCGPAIMAFGTDAQKEKHLRRILTAEDYWCTFYSEPGAGSDLASVTTSAVRDGDHWVINGQKVWNSHAHIANWGVLLVKTDPNARKHQSLTYMFVKVDSPGIEIRPLVNITGTAEFNETFFDNVRVPADQILGEVNKGWYVAAGALEFERSGVGNSIMRLNLLKDILKMAKDMGRYEDPVIRQKLAQLYVDAIAVKYMSSRNLTRALKTGRPGSESLFESLFAVEFDQRIHDMAMELQGPYSRLMRTSKHAVQHGHWQYAFLRSRGSSIETGTTEIKRNVIAQRVLGLPRG